MHMPIKLLSDHLHEVAHQVSPGGFEQHYWAGRLRAALLSRAALRSTNDWMSLCASTNRHLNTFYFKSRNNCFRNKLTKNNKRQNRSLLASVYWFAVSVVWIVRPKFRVLPNCGVVANDGIKPVPPGAWMRCRTCKKTKQRRCAIIIRERAK